jgi:AmmeMemoRadiSam system protein A
MFKLSEMPSEKPSAELTGHRTALRSAEFSLEQRRILLRLAHEAILSALDHRPLPVVPPSVPGLSEPRGVFTTLSLYPRDVRDGLHQVGDREVHRQLQLRGCVGYAMPVAPLYRAVAETARAAAFDDSRFLPVTKEEAPRLQVALSVLSRLFPIEPEAVEVGRHGLVISLGSRRGLLLPQVPRENGWDRETFLEQTCRKAGLPMDAWRKDATTAAFTAEVFSDADVAG